MTPFRCHYNTDLSDAEWALLAPFLPDEKPGGRHRENDLREVINGIRYILRTGSLWRHMPHDLPHWPLAQRWLLATLARLDARASAVATGPTPSAQCRHPR